MYQKRLPTPFLLSDPFSTFLRKAPGNGYHEQHLRFVGGTARLRRGRMLVNIPSYSQAGGVLRTYFGQECSRPLFCFPTR